MNEITAILGFLSALVGLLAAYIGRKKQIEYVVKVDNRNRPRPSATTSLKKKWYDYKLIVAISMLLFFPVGFYALYQNRTISKFWKWFWFLLFAFFLASVLDA